MKKLTVKEKAVILAVIRQALRENWIIKFNGKEVLKITLDLVESKLGIKDKERTSIIAGCILQPLSNMF